jgi:hypothetical protein
MVWPPSSTSRFPWSRCFSLSSGPSFGPLGRHGEYAMSLAQIAGSDWFLLLGTALGWLLIIHFHGDNATKAFASNCYQLR